MTVLLRVGPPQCTGAVPRASRRFLGGTQKKNRLDGCKPTGWTVSLLPMIERSMSALRDRLLDAAEAVVVRQGIANLTLDAVAAEAGLSKGGLLHHFPTKDKLVEGMVVRSAEQWRATYSA